MPTRRPLIPVAAALGLLISVATAHAQAPDAPFRSRTGSQDSAQDAKLFAISQRGIQAYYNDDYPAARAAFSEMAKLAPELPPGHVLLLGTYQGMMADYRNRKFRKEFNRLLDRSLEVTEKRIDSGQGLARAQQFRGATYGFKGLESARRRNWLTAFADGKRGYDVWLESLETRPDIADSDYGAGFFLYWRAAKSQVLNWLLFWGDTRKEGIDRLLRARREGELCDYLARIALARIYLNEKRPDDALQMTREVQQRFEGNIAAWWWAGRALRMKKDWAGMREAYLQAKRRLDRKPFASREAYFEVDYHLALAQLREGKAREAREAFQRLVKTKDLDEDLWEDDDYYELAEERFDEATELWKKQEREKK